ncbi:Uncharacterized protein ALO52_00590 [Pseudomonas syringae pv. primulae]|uniref:Uncharacterized protein n=1 Tax=Pseudomonas syringae pv. primulae TaxID=251707 RepID=A0A0Q0CYG1_9PSED|nr:MULTISPECIES: hypothetical protein [Pseudomonas syringae group]KPY31965.1 Uncharacterized protein ALO52_00590 [Pseudomonas syringae pv. primulae]MBD8185397.1 hypothetical protein [Pseudomonas viridiflava]
MAEDVVARYIHFHTPDPRLSHREQSAMTADELVEARRHAFMQGPGWLTLLFVPFLFGATLPPALSLVGLYLYKSGFAQGFDVDGALYEYRSWMLTASALLVVGWSLYNIVRAQYDATLCYWKTMPDLGRVDTEAHTLVSAINLWSQCFDIDYNDVHEWEGERQVTRYSDASQWLLAKTTTGQWLVLRHTVQGEILAGEPQVPAADIQLHPTRELVLAFAPQTNICLGKRFSGSALPVVQSDVWLTRQEEKYLSDIAHHREFFHPQRYGVVSQEDARWLDGLVQRTQHTVQPVADTHAS